MASKEKIIKAKVKYEAETKDASRNVDEFSKSVKNASSSLSEGSHYAREYSISIKNIVSRMKTFATYRMASGVINGISGSLKSAADSAIQLEREFANIQAITGSTDTTMGKLKDTILQVGQASKYSTEEIAKSTVMLGQAGLDAEEINSVLETTTQLAAATGSELSDTVDLMTSSLAVWGLNSQEAAHLSDVMVTGMNRTKATLQTFRMAVQYAGATAASLNVNFEELAAVSSAAANSGLRASVVGTGLRAVMAELISPTKKMAKGLAEMGLSTEDVDIATKGLIPVLKTLRNAGLDASNAYDMFGRRAATFILAAQGQLDVIDELQLAFIEQGVTLKAYNKQMDTISAQTTALGNTIKAICSDILDEVGWMIRDFLKGINWVLRSVRWAFSDKDKLALDEAQKYLEEDNRSVKAFSRYMDVLSSEMESGEDIADKLNETIKKINEQFGLTEEFVKPTEDLADAWKRVDAVLTDIEDKKVKEINENKINKANLIMAKELGFDEKTPADALTNPFYDAHIGVKFNYAGDRFDILRYARSYEKSLREHEITQENAEKDLEKLKESAPNMYRNLKKALEVAVKAREEVGDLIKSNADINEEKLQNSMLRLALRGKPKMPTAEDEEENGKPKGSKKPKSSTEKLGSTEYEDPKTFAQGFQDAINKMKESYTSAELGATISEDLADGMSDALNSIVTGAKSMKDAFRDLALSVVEEIQKMIIKMLVLRGLEAGLNVFTGGVSETGGVNASGSVTVFSANGGFIPKLRAAIGSVVRGGTPNKDSVPAMLMPGEYVLKKSAVDALGTNFLNDLNNNAAQTLTNTANSMFENPWEEQESEPSVVNVWVVSKEEEVRMGPNDIIATISKDIMTGGQTRKLIQSVVAGRK